jgi:hypothetical protein
MSERSGMQPIGRWRAYFAPINRAAGAVTKFAASEAFDVDAPPAPWRDLGWIKNFARRSSAELERISTGIEGLNSLRFRKHFEGQVEFDFCEWGKLQMALAAASQHVNLLVGSAYPVVGGDETSVQLSADGLAAFAIGDLVAVDGDLEMQSGFVGNGVSGAYVKDGTNASDDYIRATTYNVAKVKEKSSTSLVFESALIGGRPVPNARVQRVIGFADREGASFIQQWSALFVLEELSGGRVMLWYPRLQSSTESGEVREEIDGDTEQVALHAKFTAIPIRDDLDGETIVSCRYYLPAKSAPAY